MTVEMLRKLVFDALQRYSLLLESDSKLPSVASSIVGGPVKGSWWSHPQAQTIFQVNRFLHDHPNVLITKLVSGKVTFLHKKIWPEFISIAETRETWQTKGLSSGAQEVLAVVEARGLLRTDEMPRLEGNSEKLSDVVRQLDKRLLIHAAEMHTENGAHTKIVESWSSWKKRKKFNRSINLESAKSEFDNIIAQLNATFDAKAKLPWQ